jgi:hypothetical protein
MKASDKAGNDAGDVQRELPALSALKPDLAIEAVVGSKSDGEKPNGNSCRK